MGAAAGAIGGMAGQGAGKIGGMVGSIANYVYTTKHTVPMLKKIGRESAKDIREQGRKVGGAQHAAYAKAGVRTDVGTPVAVMAETAAKTELSALRTLFEYESAAWEAKTQAKIGLISSMLMLGGSAAQSASQMKFGGAGSSGLQGAYSRSGSESLGLPYYGSDQPSGGGVYSLPDNWQGWQPMGGSYSR